VLAAFLTNALRPKLRHAAVIGSYGWGGKCADRITELLSSPKLTWFDPVLHRGLPTDEAFTALDLLADTIAEHHKEL